MAEPLVRQEKYPYTSEWRFLDSKEILESKNICLKLKVLHMIQNYAPGETKFPHISDDIIDLFLQFQN
jgi:hypothetical protein